MQRVLCTRGLRLIITTLWALVLTGCSLLEKAEAPPADIGNAKSAIVYGYVEAEGDFIERVDFVRYGEFYAPLVNEAPRVLVYDNGMFMAENILPGKYYIAGFRSERNHYNMSRNKRESYQRIVHVEAGDVKYVGSFHVRLIPGEEHSRRRKDFKISMLQRPGERDVLKHLYIVTEGTGWQNKIRRRISELRQ